MGRNHPTVGIVTNNPRTARIPSVIRAAAQMIRGRMGLLAQHTFYRCPRRRIVRSLRSFNPTEQLFYAGYPPQGG